MFYFKQSVYFISNPAEQCPYTTPSAIEAQSQKLIERKRSHLQLRTEDITEIS